MAHQEHCQKVYDFLAADPSRHNQRSYVGSTREGPEPPAQEKQTWWQRLRNEGGFVSLIKSPPAVPAPPTTPESAALPAPMTMCTAGAAAYLAGVLKVKGTVPAQIPGFNRVVDTELRGNDDFDRIGQRYLELTYLETAALFSGGTREETARAMLLAGARGESMMAAYHKCGSR